MELSAQDVAADFAEVTHRLEEVHPDFVAMAGAERYAALREEIRGRLADVHDDAAFWWTVSPLVAAAGEGHTDLQPPQAEVQRAAGWAIRIRDGAVVVDDFGAFGGPPVPEGGARLVSLDGVPAERIWAELLARTSGETEVFRVAKARGQFWCAADPIVTALAGERHTGPWHVVLDLGGGRTKEGVVGPTLPPVAPLARGYVNADLVDPEQSPWSSWGREGAVVASLLKGGAGDRAGVEVGDVVLTIGGTATPDVRAVTDRLSRTSPGETVALHLLRDGREMDLDVRLGKGAAYEDAALFAFSDDALWFQLRSFSDDAKVLRQLDEALEEMRARGLSRVVVDLRENGGGSADLATGICQRLCKRPVEGYAVDWRRTPESQELLLGGSDVLLPVGWLLSAEIRRFLATPRGETYPYLPKTPDELRHPFDGDVVVLTDGASYSASVYATWLLRHGADARVVGEGPGSGSWFHGQTVWTLLPHSRLGLQVATGTFRCGRDQPAEDVVADEPMDPDEAFRSLLGRPPR